MEVWHGRGVTQLLHGSVAGKTSPCYRTLLLRVLETINVPQGQQPPC